MPDPSIMRIAITGSQGQLGQEFAAIAKEYPHTEFYFLSRNEFPLDDPKKMKEWLDVHALNVLINCAAYTAVDKAETESTKAYEINAEAPGIIAGLLARNKTRLIHVSTDYVFDGNSSSALREDAITVPVNIYGASKRSGELLVLKNNPDSQIIRTSWLYSAYGNNFVKTMMRLMKERPSINVVEDQVGSPTYAADLARAIMEMIGSSHFVPGIFHYSNEGETNWYAFALEIKRLTESPCAVSAIAAASYPTAAKRPVFSLLDKTKIKSTYGLQIPEWKTSLAICINLLKNLGV